MFAGGVAFAISLAGNALAVPDITPVGSGTGYNLIGEEVLSFRSDNVVKTFDAGPADNVYGSGGYLFFSGDNAGDFSNTLQSVPSFVTEFAAGADFASVLISGSGQIDDPTLPVGMDVVNDATSGWAFSSAAGGGPEELLTFTIDETVTTFRLGLMSGIEGTGDGRWDPITFGLSFEGGAAVEITALDIVAGGSAGLAFYDITTDGTAGTFAITATQRAAGQGPTLMGITFDGDLTVDFDTDGDGLSDAFEIENSAAGYDPNVDDSETDFDDDGSTVEEELARLTDVLDPDTDDDGFFDGAETNDDDGDGVFTFVSYDFTTNRGDTGTDPLVADSDEDGLLDGAEPPLGANPNLFDTDGDGVEDGVEVEFGTDPNDSSEFPDLPTVLTLSTFGTFFENDPVNPEDFRVSPTVIRAGGNGPLVSDLQFVGLLLFDLEGVDLAELQSGPLTLDFSLTAFDNTPPLDDLIIDYVGTFATDVLGGPGGVANSADPNAIAIAEAPVVTNIFTGQPELGPQSFDVTAIASTFSATSERFAVFRLTDPTLNDHEFNVPPGGVSLSVGALPEVFELVLCIEDDPAVDGNFLLSFNNEAGATYDLRSSTDLTGDPATWTIAVGDIAADASGTNTVSVALVTDPRLFYVVTEQP